MASIDGENLAKSVELVDIAYRMARHIYYFGKVRKKTWRLEGQGLLRELKTIDSKHFWRKVKGR